MTAWQIFAFNFYGLFICNIYINLESYFGTIYFIDRMSHKLVFKSKINLK